MKQPNNRPLAFIFTLGFVLQMWILVQSTLVYHEQTKDHLTQLLLDQLAGSIAVALAKQDPITIGIILGEYESIPTLAEVQVYDTNHKLLASAGNHLKDGGHAIARQINWENVPVGSISLSLIAFNVRRIVMELLVYFILSSLLWLSLYVLMVHQLHRREQVARRTLSAAQPIFEDQSASTVPVSTLDDPAILKRLQPVSNLSSNLENDAQENSITQNPSVPPITPESYPTVMILQFSDPSQLLETLSSGIAKPYFGLCQLLLDRAIHELSLEAKHKLVTPVVLQPLNQHGAVIGFMGRSISSLEYAVQLAVLFNRLSEYVYQHHRKHHRFALFTQCTIAEERKQVASAFETARGLTHHSLKNKVLIHARQTHTSEVRKQFILDPVNALAMHADDMAAIVVGVSDAGIEHHLDDISRQILQQNQVN